LAVDVTEPVRVASGGDAHASSIDLLVDDVSRTSRRRRGFLVDFDDGFCRHVLRAGRAVVEDHGATVEPRDGVGSSSDLAAVRVD